MIYISIGSNIGNRLTFLDQAVLLLKERHLKNLQCSIVLETKAILPPEAPSDWNKPFLNMIVCGNTNQSPSELLEGLKTIERELGRPITYERYSPRVIDLDIIFFDEQLVHTPDLQVPHPELCNRPFIVHLMALLNPYQRYPFITNHPFSKKTFFEIAQSVPNLQECFTRTFTLYPKLVGVLNITPDSFSDGNLYLQSESAIEKALALHSEGATIIELGAQSTRPSAQFLDAKTEYERLAPVLSGIYDRISAKNILISIDSFSSSVILPILERYPIAWVNDVKGDLEDDTLRTISKHGCKIVIMHSLGIPPTTKMRLSDELDPITAIQEWIKIKTDHLIDCGFKPNDIIIDPGIGFGKSVYQNIWLLRFVDELKKMGFQTLLGHSRKSYMSAFSKVAPSDRDLETIAISEHLWQSKVDFLRVHNVMHHQRFFVAQQSITGCVKI